MIAQHVPEVLLLVRRRRMPATRRHVSVSQVRSPHSRISTERGAWELALLMEEEVPNNQHETSETSDAQQRKHQGSVSKDPKGLRIVSSCITLLCSVKQSPFLE